MKQALTRKSRDPCREEAYPDYVCSIGRILVHGWSVSLLRDGAVETHSF